MFRQFAEIGNFASIGALLGGERWLPLGGARTQRQERPDAMTVIVLP